MLKRTIIFVHRWLGVALCSLFLLWFPSGIAMMYWDFPAVSASGRLQRAAALDPSRIVVSPGQAYAALASQPPPREVRLNTLDGRPVYRFRVGRDDAVVYADTGEPLQHVSSEMRDRIASAWTRQPASAARSVAMDAVDQWTVQGPLRTMRPLWKYSWPDGQQVYIAGSTGEVVQYTTTASRLGAYVGAIPHWLYFTPLRVHQSRWTAVVVWTSGIGTVAALLGLVIGVWMFSPSGRYRIAGGPAHIPYRGQKRWHTMFGLVFGAGAVTWAFSGMLSMDPFPARAGGDRPTETAVAEALRGRFDLSAYAAKHPHDALMALGGIDVRQLELTTLAGEPVYLATLGDGETRLVPVAGDPATEFDRDRLAAIVAHAVEPAHAGISVLDRYDRFYLDRRRIRPLPVVLARVDDDQRTRYYIDPRTARIVGTYRTRNWVSRWLYHGLHSLDFPWLYDHRPLWDIVVIVFMLGGTAISVTSVILAWRVVARPR
jgi:hypothetical protein